jgi:hypothetical protein
MTQSICDLIINEVLNGNENPSFTEERTFDGGYTQADLTTMTKTWLVLLNEDS